MITLVEHAWESSTPSVGTCCSNPALYAGSHVPFLLQIACRFQVEEAQVQALSWTPHSTCVRSLFCSICRTGFREEAGKCKRVAGLASGSVSLYDSFKRLVQERTGKGWAGIFQSDSPSCRTEGHGCHNGMSACRTANFLPLLGCAIHAWDSGPLGSAAV